MSSDAIMTVRVVLVVAAIAQLGLSTVFFHVLQKRLVEPMLRLAESRGTPTPAFVRWLFTSRIPVVIAIAPPLFLAWYVGTPAGAVFVGQILSS